jgi:hypothetical protein
VKAKIQLIAASFAQKQLNYFTFGDKALASQLFYSELNAHFKYPTIGELNYNLFSNKKLFEYRT